MRRLTLAVALDGARLLLAVRGDEPPLRRHEEARDGAAHLRLGPRQLDRLAERSGERERVQVDPERSAAELRVMAAAEPSRELDDPRAVPSEPELRVGGAVLDPQGRRGQP